MKPIWRDVVRINFLISLIKKSSLLFFVSLLPNTLFAHNVNHMCSWVVHGSIQNAVPSQPFGGTDVRVHSRWSSGCIGTCPWGPWWGTDTTNAQGEFVVQSPNWPHTECHRDRDVQVMGMDDGWVSGLNPQSAFPSNATHQGLSGNNPDRENFPSSQLGVILYSTQHYDLADTTYNCGINPSSDCIEQIVDPPPRRVIGIEPRNPNDPPDEPPDDPPGPFGNLETGTLEPDRRSFPDLVPIELNVYKDPCDSCIDRDITICVKVVNEGARPINQDDEFFIRMDQMDRKYGGLWRLESMSGPIAPNGERVMESHPRLAGSPPSVEIRAVIDSGDDRENPSSDIAEANEGNNEISMVYEMNSANSALSCGISEARDVDEKSEPEKRSRSKGEKSRQPEKGQSRTDKEREKSTRSNKSLPEKER